MKPCSTCRAIVPGGNCPKHPVGRGYKPRQPAILSARAKTGRLFRAMLAGNPDCAYCIDAMATTVDHVHPLNRTDIAPDPFLPVYLPACRPCNTSKGTRTLAEWIVSGCAPTHVNDILQLSPAQLADMRRTL